MIKFSLIILLATTLFLIALLHVYWVFGGEWGMDAVIPDKYKTTHQNLSQRSIMNIATIVVIIGLIFFAGIILSNNFFMDWIITQEWNTLATKIIGSIFLLRAIGDFDSCGIFKKASDSKFARCDTKIYVPLCLFLGMGSMLVAYL